MRAAQLRFVIAELAGIQRDTWQSGIGPIIQRSYPRAAAAAARSFSMIDKVLQDTVGRTAANVLLSTFRETARQGLELDRVRRAKVLSPRVYRNSQLASGAVERTIRAGIIQGLSAKELAGNVAKFISPSTPGGVAYAATRLARTELNNAFHEAQKIQGEAPWVAATKWNISKSHPKPDDCDRFAEQDIYDLGKGCYPADRVPDKPHPQCLCFTTYETISETEMLKLLPGALTRRTA